jgi:parvulin-like peptidyl-prolyl isomerase
MAKRKVLIVVGLLVLVVGGAVVWKLRHQPVEAAKLRSGPLTGLTQDEIVAMLEHQTLAEPARVYAIVENATTRKIFLDGLRDYLALAARARRVGLADDANIRISLEYKKNLLLASLYQNKLDNEQKQFHEIPREQIELFWRNPVNEKQFQTELGGLKAIQQSVALNSGNPHAAPQLQDEALHKTRTEWAKTKILSDMAKADAAFMNQPAVQLRLGVVEAGVLAFNYLNKFWLKNGTPTDEEIAQYLAAHPEYDVKRKLEKAEMVLQRARAGEDFAKLAAEFSEDAASKDKGGIYRDVVKGYLWPEVESVALGLSKGQIADRIVETNHGYHVVQLVDSRVAKDESGGDATKFSVRHILLRKTFPEPGTALDSNTPPSYMQPREIATLVLRNEKRRKFIDEVANEEHISLPDDFAFEITDELKAAAKSQPEQARELINKDAARRKQKH